MRQKVAFSRSGGTVSLEGTLLRGNPNVSDRVVVQIRCNTVEFLRCTAQKEAFEERRAGQSRLVLLVKHGFPRGDRFRSVVWLQLV